MGKIPVNVLCHNLSKVTQCKGTRSMEWILLPEERERLEMHASLQKKKKQTSDSIGEDEMMIILDSKSLYIKPPRTFFHPLITFCAIFAKVNKPITVWSVCGCGCASACLHIRLLYCLDSLY